MQTNYDKNHPSTLVCNATTICSIDHQTNISTKIINKKSQKSCHISGGPADTIGAIYAVECTKHNYIHTNQTGAPLTGRFKRHHLGIQYHPNRSELSKHFSSKYYDLNLDLKTSLLEQVRASDDF